MREHNEKQGLSESLIIKFLSQSDKHVNTKVNTMRFPKGGLGGLPPEAEDFF